VAKKNWISKDGIGRGSRAAATFCALFPVLVALWVLLVLYPNPLKLAASVQRLVNPRVDPRSSTDAGRQSAFGAGSH